MDYFHICISYSDFSSKHKFIHQTFIFPLKSPWVSQTQYDQTKLIISPKPSCTPVLSSSVSSIIIPLCIHLKYKAYLKYISLLHSLQFRIILWFTLQSLAIIPRFIPTRVSHYSLVHTVQKFPFILCFVPTMISHGPRYKSKCLATAS